jgi:RNA polymerase sigma factor (sigma-70 family)
VSGDGPPLPEHCAQTPQELAAFQAFYREHRDELIRYVAAIIPGLDYTLVADEALVIVWRTWNKITGNPVAWAKVVARRAAISVLRRTRELPVQPDEDTAVPLWSTTVSAELRFELHQALQHASELSDREFVSLMLPAMGFTPAEVAAQVGVTQASVRRYRCDAREKLKARISRGLPPHRRGPTPPRPDERD